MKTLRVGKFLRPMAVAAALAITTIGIPAQPATAMTPNQCRDLVSHFYEALYLGDLYSLFGANGAANFQYERAGAIAEAFGDLC